ncbi:M10 family metallopeptidase C-terminal domain-containing protein [Pseudomonas massiliensis]|uniref:M10 family metallopeptidase C-terminal domain-containing protein n=1 Tax=Pseudomonas massiliensis TaxID=522492 RepID=UPI0005901046|nr:calcium-binding protein [Pseudomonas massiliensis]
MNTKDSTPLATHTVTTAPGSIRIDVSGYADANRSIAIDQDGKIIVGGLTQYLAWGYPGAPGEESYGYEQNYSVVRLNTDGSVDRGFRDGGVSTVPAAYAPEVLGERTLVQADGKVLLALTLDDSVQLKRFNSDGSIDTGFGEKGVATFQISHDFKDPDLKVLSDGTLAFSARGPETTSVYRLNNDGSLLDSFGDQGKLLLNTVDDPYYRVGTVGVADDGSVVIGSWNHEISNAPLYVLQHFTPEGKLDTGFGNDGVVAFNVALGLEGEVKMAVQADGKIIVVGQTADDTLTSVFRLNANGTFDTSFGRGDGRVVLEFEQPMSLAVQQDGKILLGGSDDRDLKLVRLNEDGTLDSGFGSQDGKPHIDGYLGDEVLQGTGVAEVVDGHAGDDVLQGNGGRDLLQGGAGADVFRYAELSDSYRTATQNNSDRISDFDASEDRIDLTALGFTGIGNGHDGTLAIQASADGSRTYLKSYDVDGAGHRFELALNGNLVGQLNETNLIFTAPSLEGTSAKDVITGSALSEVILGLDGNDRINAGAGADVIIGGRGADRLEGGDRADIDILFDNAENADIFRYTSVEDSYRIDTQSFVDLIVNMTVRDKIDVSALGYTGFGDGTGDTLRMVYNAQLERTYLQNTEANSQGHKFQVALEGDWRESLYDSNMIFASPEPVALVGVTTVADEQHLIG